MWFIGVTGGIGAGKSTVLSYIREHYRCEIYLADDVAKELEAPGTAVYRDLVSLLGLGILAGGEGSEIDARKLSAVLFTGEASTRYGSADLVVRVNEIVHPAVRAYLLTRLQEARERGDCDLFLVEAALLIEAGYENLVDEMWVVAADEATRVKRLMESRGYSEEKARGIMRRQLSEADFRAHADFVIDNSAAPGEAFAQVRSRLEELGIAEG